MPKICGYTLKREIVDVLVSKNPHISADKISKAGGGVITLVLSVESARRMRIYNLAKDLRFHSRYSAARTVAVSMPALGDQVWEIVPLSYLQSLAEEAALTKDQFRLEAALRPRV